MEILEKIYEMYTSNSLELRPEKTIRGIREEMEKLEEEFELSSELADEIEEAILEIVAENQKAAFFEGFKLAGKFLKEMLGE